MKLANVDCPRCGEPLAHQNLKEGLAGERAIMTCKKCKIWYPITIAFTIEPLLTEPKEK